MRMHMLTASNVASYLGMNKYCSRKRFLKRLYEDLNKPVDRAISPARGFKACEWGSKYEAEAAVLYQMATGNRCFNQDLGLVIHPEHRFLGASPDRVLVDRPILIEIKAPFKREIEPETMPLMYMPQVQAQMQVCGMDECHFVQFKPASLCAPGILSVLVVDRDDEWWRQNIARIAEFEQELAKMEPATATTDEPAAKKARTTPTTPPAATTTTIMDAAITTTTVSPGIYNIFIDKRLSPSPLLLEGQSQSCSEPGSPSKPCSAD